LTKKIITKEFMLGNVKIEYVLQYKNVKNINIRIKPDGKVYVSTSKRNSQDSIERILASKSDFVLRALKRLKTSCDAPLTQYFNEKELKEFVTSCCRQIYPYFREKGILFPEIRFRKMVSRWGSCIPSKGVVTFNTNLIYASAECVEYVVMHEFTHFLHPNHQAEFYDELSIICPKWKEYRKTLKSINIRIEKN